MMEVLFWTGIRSGEALALTPADINFKKNTLHINKRFAIIDGKHNIDTPKTPSSVRRITIPQTLSDDLRSFIRKAGIGLNDRICDRGRTYLNKKLSYGVKKSGVKRIRVHDLRHSHASLLIDQEFPILAISERLGHKSTKTTLDTYGHLYPNKQEEMAIELQKLIDKKPRKLKRVK